MKLGEFARWLLRPVLQPPDAQPILTNAPPRALVFFCISAILLGSWWWNHNFGAWTTVEMLSAMTDVPDIWRGFQKTPDIWRDGCKWWSGPWIQEGIGAFRPVSSYLLWFETWLGFRFGFNFVAWIGIALVALCSTLCCLLAWTFTRSAFATFTAAILSPSARFWLMGGAPDYWLAWYAGHHDLWMIACLLAALWAWTKWLRNGERRFLVTTWAAFIVGTLSKEFVYIFPAMALAVALTLPQVKVERRKFAFQCMAFCGFVVVLYLYRHAVLPVAYNPPPLKKVHLIKRPFLYWLPSFYKYVLAQDWFLPSLALWFFGAIGLWARVFHRIPSTPRFRWLPLALFGGGTLLVCALTQGVAEGFWYLFEPTHSAMRLLDLAQMGVTFYFFWLILKYRRRVPTLAILLVFLLSYVPVWTYLGWHYTLAGWFVRSALWWPLLAALLEWEAKEFLPFNREQIRRAIQSDRPAKT